MLGALVSEVFYRKLMRIMRIMRTDALFAHEITRSLS